MKTLSRCFGNLLKKGKQILFFPLRWLPDKWFLKLKYWKLMNQHLDLKNPRSFGEKLQWLKLYDHCPEYTQMVDKVKAKDYVATIIGDDYVIPTLGVWDRPEDIDWDKLPGSFVLKTNHSGGNTGVIICRDKESFDRHMAVKTLNQSLQCDIYRDFREWPYKNVQKRVFAEEYIAPPTGVKDLPDYKWFCFDGEPRYCQVIQNRTTHETIDFFDTEWNHQVFYGLNPKGGPVYGPAEVPPERPFHLSTHIHIARELSRGIPFVRVDLYETSGGVYFGEITFYPMSGMGCFQPNEWDYALGELIHLPASK